MEPNQQTNPHPKTKEDDIDLGLVIYKTGKLISKFFSWLSGLFSLAGIVIMNFLFFVRRNLLWLFFGTLLGFCFGLYLLSRNGATYHSEMTVRSNFSSGRALYSTSEFLNSMISSGRYEELGQILNIPPKEATSLLHFEVKPVQSELIIAQMYREQFLTFERFNKIRTDTFWTKTIKYQDFKESLTDFDYPLHDVSLASTSPEIFRKIQEGFIRQVDQNQLLQQIRNNEIETNKEEVDILVSSIQSLDTLRQSYNKRLTMSSGTNPPGNSLTMLNGSETVYSPELELYDKLLLLKDELKLVKKQAAVEKNILEVYSPFSPFGKKESFFKQNMVRYAIFGFLCTFILISLINIYRMLGRIEKKAMKNKEVSA